MSARRNHIIARSRMTRLTNVNRWSRPLSGIELADISPTKSFYLESEPWVSFVSYVVMWTENILTGTESWASVDDPGTQL